MASLPGWIRLNSLAFARLLLASLGLTLPLSLPADPVRYLGGTTFLTTTKLTVGPGSEPRTIGSALTLTAKTSGANFLGVTVSFYVDGVLIGTALTGESSEASITWNSVALAEGPHTFRVDFPQTVIATRQVATHVPIFENNVFAGYFDIYQRDFATASADHVVQRFLPGFGLSASYDLEDKSFRLLFEARAEWDYPLEVSTNLTDWIVLTNLPWAGGTNLVVDAEAVRYPRRFYRVRVVSRVAE